MDGVVGHANVRTWGEVCSRDPESAGLHFAGQETGNAGGDAHRLVDTGFEVSSLREKRTAADGFEGREKRQDFVGQSLVGGGIVEDVENGACDCCSRRVGPCGRKRSD